jgi:hypothetical protein
MSWPADAELEVLVTRFRDRTLPKPEWTHEAHLTVGAWHVHRLGADALAAVREGILRLNEAHGTANTDHGGYHETITRTYLALIDGHRATLGSSAGPGELARSILAGPLAARDALLTYYTKDRLMSTAGRRGWLEPDRSLLPTSIGSSPTALDGATERGVA